MSFDLDETLLDNRFIPVTIAACCAFLGERLGVAAAVVADANAAAWSGHWPHVEAGLALGSPTGGEMIREVWRRALASCGCEDAAVLDDVVSEHLRLDRENARLFDDVAPTVDALRSEGHRLALITNGASDVQRARLAALGMEGWFDVVVISAEVGAVKPAATVFDLAAAGLGVGGRDLWHVGDTLATDVAGALAAGHTAVWLNRRGASRRPEDPAPHVELTTLRDLPAALAG